MCGRRSKCSVDGKHKHKIWSETPTGKYYFEVLDLDRKTVKKLIPKNQGMRM
jgi:hypothetical protein